MVKGSALLSLAVLLVLAPAAAARSGAAPPPPDQASSSSVRLDTGARPAAIDNAVEVSAAERLSSFVEAQLRDDLAAMKAFRPGYPFWQHIFTIPDGSIAYGSATDGRLLAVFPTNGDWRRAANWKDRSLASSLGSRALPRSLSDRREEVAKRLEPVAGPLLHNPTRGLFLLPNAKRYGNFLTDWGAIYERFGAPADLGLAQALIESGLNGTIRSEARAIGFCQWLSSNWNQMKRLSPHVIEGHNQTTQAPYCAAYLTVLATKYGSFIPALSEHHSGGTNVGRQLINGERLGGPDTRTQYFLGAELTRDIRVLAPRSYRDVYGSYGPRSFRYAEMVFGNTFTVASLRESMPQARIHAMRTRRAIPLTEITRRTGLSADEVRRYNPALVRQVPARATLYLPRYISDFGADVGFWHRPASPAFTAALDEFVRLNVSPEDWDTPGFTAVLRGFAERFRATKTEEGTVMATVLAYVIEDIRTSGRGAILSEFRTSAQIRRLFSAAVLERAAATAGQPETPRLSADVD
jgi:hypothetical protein